MKSLIVTVVLTVCALAAVSCRRYDVRTVTIHVPEMGNKECSRIVEDALAKVGGIQMDKLKVDTLSRTVTVMYDSLQLSIKNVEFAIAEAGFAANDVPAKREAQEALPPECK